MAIIQSISALLTDTARTFNAKAMAEGLQLGDWSFQIGTAGFVVLTPDETIPVDQTQQALLAPIGGTRFLGRVLASGFGASVTMGPGAGYITINGLTGMTSAISRRWLRLYGSADPNINGTWVIAAFVSSSSVVLHNPLATLPEVGPLGWELREACVAYPNGSAVAFHGRIEGVDVANNNELGEVGIFGRVIRSPIDPALLGTTLLFANAHFPARAKFAEMTLNLHVCVQA